MHYVWRFCYLLIFEFDEAVSLCFVVFLIEWHVKSTWKLRNFSAVIIGNDAIEISQLNGYPPVRNCDLHRHPRSWFLNSEFPKIPWIQHHTIRVKKSKRCLNNHEQPDSKHELPYQKTWVSCLPSGHLSNWTHKWTVNSIPSVILKTRCSPCILSHDYIHAHLSS